MGFHATDTLWSSEYREDKDLKQTYVRSRSRKHILVLCWFEKANDFFFFIEVAMEDRRTTQPCYLSHSG